MRGEGISRGRFLAGVAGVGGVVAAGVLPAAGAAWVEGGAARRLRRRQGARVHLSVGCEFVLYVPGIVPGADVMERIENLLNGTFDPVRMTRRLSSFIARSAAVGRSVSGGPMTYGAAQEDDLDMASYSVVKTVRERPDDPASAWRWEPKRAFHALAGHYGRHAARR
ncbi:hypothetical protein ACIOGX_12340 [Streptomyces sp. NPDC088147]|uniref:hypothetical protein n=1 Tax=Streptomyces sp. NPDC088147 TaxID=3365830 RepID=UPI0038012F9C